MRVGTGLPRRWRSGLLVVAAAGVSACAAAPRVGVPTAADVPSLEARYRSAPGDADLRVRLAAGYRAAGRPADAIALLEPAGAAEAVDGAAVVLAESYGDVERFGDARSIYTRLAGGADRRLAEQARTRLAALEREELRAAVRQAIRNEANLQTVPSPDAVGVFPFLFAAQNADLAPLSRALAELLSVDLAQTDRLRVVERAQLQYLLDELRLGDSGRVDPATEARAGRMMGAGRIVQGRIDGAEDTLRLQALLVPAGEAPGDPLIEQGALRALFEMEKALALSLYDEMGVQLTAAERARVNRRPTENLQALLAFGFALEASDEGRHEEALEHMRRAAALDPGFDLADTWTDRLEAQVAWTQLGPDGLIVSTLDEDPLPRWLREREPFIEIEQLIPDPAGRDPAVEALGVEGLDRGAILRIIIRRPAGGE